MICRKNMQRLIIGCFVLLILLLCIAGGTGHHMCFEPSCLICRIVRPFAEQLILHFLLWILLFCYITAVHILIQSQHSFTPTGAILVKQKLKLTI